jgi:hypothetical protein
LVVTWQPDDWQDEQPERDASYLFPDAVYDVVKPPLHLIGVRFKYPGAWNVHFHFSIQGSQLADELA